MELNGNIAQISPEIKTHSVKHITFYVKNLQLKCKRCTTFCCKLGGPTLSPKDVERLRKTGHLKLSFLMLMVN